MKTKRHSKILELISEKDIATQEDLLVYLRESGFDVTQATVSRDIRDLKLTKVLTRQGTYRYVIPTNPSIHTASKINETLMSAITGIDFAGNMVVVTAYPGMAQAVASGIDSEKTNNILGCVGGDDTIIVVTRNEDAAREFCTAFREQKMKM